MAQWSGRRPSFMSSRRQRSAPKANVSASVRAGLLSIVDGNESGIRSMLQASKKDDLVEKLIECMGVNNLNAEMLLANYFSQQMLGAYAARLGKSDKGGTATLAERIAREWAKPSFAPPATSKKRKEGASDDEDEADDAAAKRMSALEQLKAKRVKQQAAKEIRAAAAAAEAAMSSGHHEHGHAESRAAETSHGHGHAHDEHEHQTEHGHHEHDGECCEHGHHEHGHGEEKKEKSHSHGH